MKFKREARNPVKNAIVIIPARLAATRLPNKPLLRIAGVPMILHVVARAEEAGFPRVIVAAGDKEIVDVVTKAGKEAVLTDAAIPSGTDRIYAALQAVDPKGIYQTILNVQGDEPAIEPEIIRSVAAILEKGKADISTAVVPLKKEDEQNPHAVKATMTWYNKSEGHAENFSRVYNAAKPDTQFHHVGIYGYRKAALERFVKLPPSVREKEEKLEQLRALDAGMTIDAVRVNKESRGVDTAADLTAVTPMVVALAKKHERG
ncbi:MAG: 3-deoxy-manno-octulosonate cytidylyltransferase [Proteobacteria bacterium]|nr:3-deoxy-manno-octulosonate cytidylyltransferase [Pseudomonadota bacterium]